MNEAERIINDLLDYFSISTYEELAEKLGTTQAAISQWKKRNSTSAIERKMREHHVVLHSQNLNKYDEMTYLIFQDTYSKAKENGRLKDLQIYLLKFG